MGRTYGRKTSDERRSERRERLLLAAVDAYGTRGYRGTTIEALCTAAGVSTRNFYEEFASREVLLVALHDDLNARAFEAVVAAMTHVDPNDIAARAKTATRAYLDVMTSDRRWARIALVESVGVSQEAEEARRAAVDRFVALIELEANRLAGSGVIAKRDYSLTAVALAGALNGLILTWSATDDWDKRVQDIADEAARLIVLAFTA